MTDRIPQGLRFGRRYRRRLPRPYLAPLKPSSVEDTSPASRTVPETPSASAEGLLSRVLHGLRALPAQEEPTTPLIRLIDAQKAPTEEIPIVTAEGGPR